MPLSQPFVVSELLCIFENTQAEAVGQKFPHRLETCVEQCYSCVSLIHQGSKETNRSVSYLYLAYS